MLVHSIHQQRVSPTPVLAFCSHCHSRYFVSTTYFVQTHGPACDCSWACCPPSSPRSHQPHIVHRPASPDDLAWAEQNNRLFFKKG